MMQKTNTTRTWILTFVLLLTGLAPSVPAFAQRIPERFDLADAVLLPRDLDRVGMPGFAVDRAFWIDSEAVVYNIGLLFDVDEREFESAFDSDAGFQFAYDSVLQLAIDEGPTQVEIRNTLTQFESDNEADDAFDALSEVVDDDNAIDGEQWGDHSLVYVSDSAMAIMLRAEQMLSVIVIESDFLEVDEQHQYFVSRMVLLANRSVASIREALDRSGPEFGVTAIRFEIEEPDRVIAGDRYTVDNGQFAPMTTTHSFQTSSMGIQIDAFQIDSAYERFLYPSGLEGAIVNLTINRHATPELAETYVEYTQDRLDFSGGYSNLEEVPDLDLPGDSAVAFSYTFSYTEELVTTGLALVVQVDDQVIQLQVDSTDGVDEDEVLAVVEMQVSCLLGSECEPVPYPGD